MKHKKICFITCVNDSELYNESLKYLNNLSIPEGFEIENLEIKEARSITSGYNEGMKTSDAKYKVYLHQDVFIINKNFIFDILEIFNSDNKIGILGVAGAKTIPTNAVWWDSTHRFGKVYENHSGKMKLLAFDEVQKQYEEVKALDGLILVTQQDVPWREDIFTGWHFYDLSQCTEFILKGYKVVVPKQHEAWCIHDCGFVETENAYEEYKEVFLAEYSKKIFPLVSIMITAYNRPQYLKIALESALNQTYRNIEIVLCDNSTNDKCEKLIKKYLAHNEVIRYYRNEKELEVIDNFKKCLKLAKGEYAEFLMDDDVYHAEKTNKMMNYFLESDDISLVTSFRQPMDKNGNYLEPKGATLKLFDENIIVEGKIFLKFIFDTLNNVIGETTTPLFRLKELANNFGLFNGVQYEVLTDLVSWINLMLKGKFVYISEPLSYFRIHESQDQKKVETMLKGAREFLDLIKEFKENKIVEFDYDYTLLKWRNRNKNILNLNCDNFRSACNIFIKEFNEVTDYLQKKYYQPIKEENDVISLRGMDSLEAYYHVRNSREKIQQIIEKGNGKLLT